PAPARGLRVFRVAPQRIVVAAAVGEMARAVPGDLVVVRLGRLLLLDADFLAQALDAFVGEHAVGARFVCLLLRRICHPFLLLEPEARLSNVLYFLVATLSLESPP